MLGSMTACSQRGEKFLMNCNMLASDDSWTSNTSNTRDNHLLFFLFRGWPTGKGRNRRPTRFPILLMKLSLPSGRPRLVRIWACRDDTSSEADVNK